MHVSEYMARGSVWNATPTNLTDYSYMLVGL